MQHCVCELRASHIPSLQIDFGAFLFFFAFLHAPNLSVAKLTLAVVSAKVMIKQTAQAPSAGSDEQCAQKETALRSEWDWGGSQSGMRPGLERANVSRPC